jgi:hypothetical protein
MGIFDVTVTDSEGNEETFSVKASNAEEAMDIAEDAMDEKHGWF